MKELRDLKRKIFDRLRETGQSVYDTAVPRGAKPPFLRFYLTGMDFISSFQSPHHFSRAGITVEAVSAKEASTEAEELFASAQEKLEGFSFETEQGRHRLQLSAVRKTHDSEAGLWYISGDFILHSARKA